MCCAGASQGQFGPVIDFPMVPVASAMLPDGKVCALNPSEIFQGDSAGVAVAGAALGGPAAPAPRTAEAISLGVRDP